MERTNEQIRTAGLQALRRRLGVTGMIRFLQQFESGKGDYVKERRKWVDHLTMDDLEVLLAEHQKKRGRAGSGRGRRRAGEANARKTRCRNSRSRKRSA